MYRCALCGECLEFMSDHHLATHNITKEKYVEKYGLKKLTFRDLGRYNRNKKPKSEIESYVLEGINHSIDKILNSRKKGRKVHSVNI